MIDLALRAARPVGDGLYGVDLKQTPDGIVVMEVNDNPNIEHGIEDAVGKDEVWIAHPEMVHRAAGEVNHCAIRRCSDEPGRSR